jgi:serine/threonine protein kinase
MSEVKLPPSSYPVKISEDQKEIISHLLRRNPDTRPSIGELLSFQIIKSKAKYLKIELPAVAKAAGQQIKSKVSSRPS